MKTPRIEEMVEEVASKMGFRTEVSFHTETIRQALTEAHQAGIDEAVELLRGNKLDLSKGGNQYGSGYNKALDDTIKALQDNK